MNPRDGTTGDWTLCHRVLRRSTKHRAVVCRSPSSAGVPSLYRWQITRVGSDDHRRRERRGGARAAHAASVRVPATAPLGSLCWPARLVIMFTSLAITLSFSISEMSAIFAVENALLDGKRGHYKMNLSPRPEPDCSVAVRRIGMYQTFRLFWYFKAAGWQQSVACFFCGHMQ